MEPKTAAIEDELEELQAASMGFCSVPSGPYDLSEETRQKLSGVKLNLSKLEEIALRRTPLERLQDFIEQHPTLCHPATLAIAVALSLFAVLYALASKIG